MYNNLLNYDLILVYRKELADTKQELDTISIEIDSLLQRQASLQQRKTELDSILRQSSAKSDDNDKKWDKQGKLVKNMKNRDL